MLCEGKSWSAMPGSLRRVFFFVMCAMALGSGTVSAADVPPHLVGMARSLLSQIDEADFAASGDPALARRIADIVRLTRLRSWAGSPPKISVDPAMLASPLGLDYSQDRHRAALETLLAARDPVAQTEALGAVLKLTGQRRAPEALGKTFRDTLADQLAPLQKRAKLEGEAGQSIEIEWDPDTASVLARIKLGEGQDEVVLQGGAPGKFVDGHLAYDVEADAAPVARITPSMQAEINASVFGVWRGSDGAQWMIRGGQEVEAAARAKTDPATLALEQIDRDRRQVAALEKEKVYIWVDPQGGEVIQKKFKRLDPPFRYDRARSENIHKAEITALKERISAAEKALQLPPAKQHDPLKLKNSPADTRRAIEIEVWESSGRRYLYDEAAFDGKRLTASRTLRDAADIFDLPQWVIDGLIASWSPPEWIDLEAKLNPRDKSIRLEGQWWRLNVTYDPTYRNINSIHTPYDKPLVLRRDHEDIMLRIVDLDGRVKDVIRHDDPFRLQALFNKAPEGEQRALVTGEGGKLAVALSVAGGASNPRLLESGILYGCSVQFAKRKDIGGLSIKERFVAEEEFEAKSAEWRKLADASQRIAADLFEGSWQVTHSHEDGSDGLNGVAQVNRAGTSARLVLGNRDTTRLYQSIDMNALRGTDPDPYFLEIMFERVASFGEEPASASPAPMRKGELIYFPTLTRSFDAELDGAHASAGLDLKPAPEEIIHVLLKSRDKAHLAGGWNAILENGDVGSGGQQTWLRDIEIAGVVVMEDQYRRDSPTTAYYPWGPQASAGSSSERTLFIFGRHLPTSRGDAVVFKSLTEGISYHTYEFPDEKPPKLVEDAWRKAAEVPRRPRTIEGAPQEAVGPKPIEKFVRQADDVGIFVTARFAKGTEPGVKAFALNAVSDIWLLDFADARGRAYFVDTPPVDGAPTDIFKSSDSGFLELELEAPIPYKEPLIFAMSKDGAAVGEIPLALLTGEASDGREGRVYRSPPLHFFRSDLKNWAPPDEAGAIRFDVAPQPGAPDRELDNQFKATWTEPLRLSVPKPAEMRIIDEDDDTMSEVWQKALERAAACYGGKVKIDPRATSQENSDFILTELWSFRGPFKKANITIGDHAAGILIRDEFVEFSRALAQSYTDTSGYDSDLDKFIENGVASVGRSDPLWKVMANKVGAEEYSAEQMLDINGLASLRKISREDAIDFRREQVRTMLHSYVSSVHAAIRRAKDAEDCKVDELLVIAGQPAPIIVARILPRLVSRKEEDGRIFWEPDMVARAYVRTLYIKGAELRALSEYAAIDDTYKALALAAVGGGVGALASRLGYLGVAAYATVTADAIDVAYFGAKGVLDYQKAEEFYDYAKGASAAFGADFYEEAAAQRQSALGAAAGVLLPGLGVAAGTLGDLRHLARAERGAEIARRFSTVDAASLAKLSDAERLDLLAYVAEIKEAARVAQLPEALKNAAGLEKAGRAWDLVKGAATSTGRRLDEADTNFLKAFNTHASNMQAQIERGRDIAARLDDFDGPALNLLTPAERADLAEYVKNVRFRESALKSGDFGTSLAVPSARESDLARNFDDMTKAADEAASASLLDKAAPTAGPVPAPRVSGDQAQLTPSHPATTVPNQPVRAGDNSARGPPLEEPAVNAPEAPPPSKVDANPPAAADEAVPSDPSPPPSQKSDSTVLEPPPRTLPEITAKADTPATDAATNPRPPAESNSTVIEPPPRAQPEIAAKADTPATDAATNPRPPAESNSTVIEPPPRAQPEIAAKADTPATDAATNPRPPADPNSITIEPPPRSQPEAVAKAETPVTDDATKPHPPPDADATIDDLPKAAEAEASARTDRPLADDAAVLDESIVLNKKIASAELAKDPPAQAGAQPGTPADAPPPGPQANLPDSLPKTEAFPPPKELDPANPAQAPPPRTRIPFEPDKLSTKLDLAPDYKFSKPAPSVKDLPDEDVFFAGDSIQFTTGVDAKGAPVIRRIPGNSLVADDGSTFELGKLVGKGSGASVFANAADPTQVIRISEISADPTAAKFVHYDMVGRYVGEAVQRPDGNGFFRLTRTYKQFIAKDLTAKTKYLVTIEENIAHTGGGVTNALDRFRVTPPNAAQEMTKALAIREMNRRGVVWTDHKLANFDIIENPASPTGYQMLIFDTGGIRPVTGQFVYERAATAEAVQRLIDQSPDRYPRGPFFEFATQLDTAGNYFDNRVFGALPAGETGWSPIVTLNQLNRPDGYHDFLKLRADDLEDRASEQFGKDIRLPSLR
ncbi:MAG: hypothetical protein ACOZAM_01060 [Pseudomonadota bacterium]